MKLNVYAFKAPDRHYLTYFKRLLETFREMDNHRDHRERTAGHKAHSLCSLCLLCVLCGYLHTLAYIGCFLKVSKNHFKLYTLNPSLTYICCLQPFHCLVSADS
jgi:hypothetical protein